MGKIGNKYNPPVIGRVKAAIISEDGDNYIGIVSEIIIRSSSHENADRLFIQGPGRLDESNKKHLESVVLPIVDKITEHLGIFPKNYEISVKNLGAIASAGVGLNISGFSADLPIFLACISTALQIGIRQDVLCTGHIASMEGDLAPVAGTSPKLEAAVSTPDISAFVFPELGKDRSLQVLTPHEYEAAKESLLRYRGQIKVHPISGIHDAFRILMTDDSIVLGSLKKGFFNVTANVRDLDDPISMSVAMLSDGNEKRFWDSLEHSLLNRKIDQAHLFLQNFADFHVKNFCYPEDFGEQLLRLVISLPPSLRNLDNLFPLIQMESLLKLSQFAQAKDHQDIRNLFKAAFGEQIDGTSHRFEDIRADQSFDGATGNQLFEGILAEISEENISKKVGHSFDNARSRYVMDSVTVKDGFEFNKAITAFYAHIFRHTASPAGQITKDASSKDAIELVENAFKSKGGYDAAVAEGMYGTNGGMRLVLDLMTEFLKQKERKKYINMVFKEAIDPNDWDLKVKLAEILKKLVGVNLPAELREVPAELLARNLEQIVACYSESMDKVSTLLKRF